MKFNHFFIAPLLALAIFTTACQEDKPCVVGSGTLQDYPLNLGEFQSIEVSGKTAIILSQATVQSLLISAEPEIYGVMTHSVSNDELSIGFENGVCTESQLGIVVRTTAAEYEKISVSGVAEITSDGDLNDSKIEIEASGSATSRLTGNITHQVIDVSGDIKVQHYAVVSDIVDIDVSGAADIEVFAAKELNIDVSGSATILYKGSPVITQKGSGVIKLINMN